MLFNGVKHLGLEFEGNPLEDSFPDDVNHGSLLVTSLLTYKGWAKTTNMPQLYIGGFLTPIFHAAKVPLEQHTPND